MSAAAMSMMPTLTAATCRSMPAVRRSACRRYRMYIRLLGTCLLALASCTSAYAAEPAGHDWQPLFDGKTLTGWRASEAPGSFGVRDGAIRVRICTTLARCSITISATSNCSSKS
jgi:hypothetical protein